LENFWMTVFRNFPQILPIIGLPINGIQRYLAKKGKKVAVIEKQHLIGGAAVT
jgi:UDP-galactopyranose mutase